jgi:polyhydroxyalkanoate synthesis regulator phasin
MEDMEFLKAMLAEMNANTKSNQEQMKETVERQVGSLVSKMEANRKTDIDEMKQEMRAGHVRCPS